MVLRRAAGLGLVALTAGCASVREVFEPAEFISAKRPAVVYVTQRSRAVVWIANPRVSGDTLFGTVAGDTRPVAVPLMDVQSVSASRMDGGRTALLALTVVGGTAFAAYIFSSTTGPSNGWVCDYDPPGGRDPAGGPVCGFTN